MSILLSTGCRGTTSPPKMTTFRPIADAACDDRLSRSLDAMRVHCADVIAILTEEEEYRVVQTVGLLQQRNGKCGYSVTDKMARQLTIYMHMSGLEEETLMTLTSLHGTRMPFCVLTGKTTVGNFGTRLPLLGLSMQLLW